MPARIRPFAQITINRQAKRCPDCGQRVLLPCMSCTNEKNAKIRFDLKEILKDKNASYKNH